MRDSLPIDMLLSAVSVLVVAQSSSEVPEGLMNNPVYIYTIYIYYIYILYIYCCMFCKLLFNFVNYANLLLCLCILIIMLCTFLLLYILTVMFMYSYC